MCKAMDHLCQEAMNLGESRGIEIGEKRGESRGERKAKKETALSLYEMGISIEMIAQAVKMNLDTIRIWLKVKRD